MSTDKNFDWVLGTRAEALAHLVQTKQAAEQKQANNPPAPATPPAAGTDWKAMALEALQNPYVLGGLGGAGVGGLLGAGRNLMRERGKRRFWQDITTGAALGGMTGLGGVAGANALLKDKKPGPDKPNPNVPQGMKWDPERSEDIKRYATLYGADESRVREILNKVHSGDENGNKYNSPDEVYADLKDAISKGSKPGYINRVTTAGSRVLGNLFSSNKENNNGSISGNLKDLGHELNPITQFIPGSSEFNPATATVSALGGGIGYGFGRAREYGDALRSAITSPSAKPVGDWIKNNPNAQNLVNVVRAAPTDVKFRLGRGGITAYSPSSAPVTGSRLMNAIKAPFARTSNLGSVSKAEADMLLHNLGAKAPRRTLFGGSKFLPRGSVGLGTLGFLAPFILDWAARGPEKQNLSAYSPASWISHNELDRRVRGTTSTNWYGAPR